MKFAKYQTVVSLDSPTVKEVSRLTGNKNKEALIKGAEGFVATQVMPVGCKFKVTGVSVELVKGTKNAWGRVECKDVKTGDTYVVSAKTLCGIPSTLDGWETNPEKQLTHTYTLTQGAKKPLTKLVSPDLQPLTEMEHLFVPPTRNWFALMDWLSAELSEEDNGELGEAVFTYKGTVCREFTSKSPIMIAKDYCEAGWERVLCQKVFTV